MSCSDNWLVPAANPCLGVKEVIAGTNVTITGSIYTPTINATGSSGGGVTSLAYTTGINGSAATGAITLSNTGVTSIVAGTGIGVSGTGAVTVTNNGITSLIAGTGISVSGATITNTGVTSLALTGGGGLYNLGTATAPILGALVVDVLAGTGISVASSSGNKTVTNTGVTSIVAGTGISISGATGAVTINNTGSSSPSMTAIFTPLINPGWTAIDGDVEILAAQLNFGVSFTNLATAETIVVHFSCGPILGTSTAGPTNASYFAMKALVTPSTAGTPVDTPAYGQYVVDYGAVMGGDFIVILSKARGEFFSDSRFIKLYKMDLPAAPFSSAILPAIAVPTIYVNMYAM